MQGADLDTVSADGQVLSPDAQAQAARKEKRAKPTRGGGAGFGAKAA